MPQTPLPVIVNRDGGTAARQGGKLEANLREAFAAAKQPIDLQLVTGSEIARAVTSAPGRLVAVGGGDGTIACAADVLAHQHRRLAVLPLGTLNHFARAIGLSGDLTEAAQAAAHGVARRVDLGRVGNKVFINNASLGLYARMVVERERNPLPKWLATIPAALAVLARPGARRLALQVDGETMCVKTPLLFIGNNRYSLESGMIGQRASLSEGVLSAYAVAQRGGFGLLAAAARILAGKVNFAADFAATAEAGEIVIQRSGRHHLALDGEVVELEFPLTFSAWPGALQVMMPLEIAKT